jgi:hypothetical protein
MIWMVEFIEAPLFTQLLANFLTDDEYRGLQEQLAREPEAGDVVPGTGGFRKLRWADPRRGKGKRGGLRMIYYHFPADSQIWLLTVYDKDTMKDLTPAEKRILKAAIQTEAQTRATRKTQRRN